MIKSYFSHFESHIDNGKIKNLQKLLNDVGATASVKDIYLEFGEDAERVITYIIMVYCSDSSYINANVEYRSQKEIIAQVVGLDTFVHRNVINPKSESVLRAINFFADETKGWKYRKMISLRESAQELNNVSRNQLLLTASKSPAKLIRDCEIYGMELSEKADKIQKEIEQQTKSPDRLKESIEIENMSYEKILRSITKPESN